MKQSTILRKEWRPIHVDAMRRLDEVLASWEETKYMALQCRKRVGVDCIRFVCAVADEMYGFSRGPMVTLPPDQAMHDRRGAIAAMRVLTRRYAPLDNVTKCSWVEPLDILVSGPLGGGPGHALLIGTAPGHVWESTMNGVQRSGMPAFGVDTELFRIYRVRDKHLWQTR